MQPAVRTVWDLIKRSAIKWNEDDCLTLGAALAYYTVFSLAPILVIVIAVSGALFGQEAARARSSSRSKAWSERKAPPPSSLLVLLFGSTSAFSQLQSALNRIWEVPLSSHSGLWDLIRARFLSFAAVLGTGFLLSVSLVLSAAVAAFGRFGWGWVPGISRMLELADFLGSMLVHTLLFAMIFRLLPDAVIRWRDVWVGAAVTAALFFVGKAVIGLYLGSSELGAAYGAASWVILVLAWVYYSTQIVLFGAEFTRVYGIRATSPRRRHGGAAVTAVQNPYGQ